MKFPLAAFESFAQHALIPSKDRGWIPCWPLFGTQTFIVREIARALEDDIHEIVGLKARQVGWTTLLDLLILFWLQRYSGMTGILVCDTDDNRDYRRDLLRQMHASCDGPARGYALRLDNLNQLAFAECHSRLLFASVGKRENRSFGRSRGINFAIGDEVGAWPFQKAVSALRAAFSERHPRRLYVFGSTAQGHDIFWEMWKEAADSPTKRRIFVGWYLHEGYQVAQTNREVWERYDFPPTDDERVWMIPVAERYGVEITPEQLVWYRWQLDATYFGDEDMRAQELPCLPEEAFVSFGDKFIAPRVVRALRQTQDTETPKATRWKYVWGRTLEASRTEPADPRDATLLVWEEPDPQGVYLVSCHPAYSSTSRATDDVIQVWRAYPDRLVQAAEYVIEGGGPTYQLAWAIMALAGAYRQARRVCDIYFILDVQMTGRAVLTEIERIENMGYGVTTEWKERGREIQNLMGSLRQYLFRRPDSFSGVYARQWQSQPNYRPMLLNALRDEIVRGHTEIRSGALVDELATLRRGEAGDADVIAAGGPSKDCRAMAMAMGIWYWLETVIQDLAYYQFAPKEPPEVATHVGQELVGGFLGRLARTGR